MVWIPLMCGTNYVLVFRASLTAAKITNIAQRVISANVAYLAKQFNLSS